MQEQNIQAKHKGVFMRLNKMGNQSERTSAEHLRLYDCYADLVRQAITHKDTELQSKHLVEASTWYEEKVTGAEWRNQPKGLDAEEYQRELKQ